MKRECHKSNWAAALLTGGLAALLLQVSACSTESDLLPPPTASNSHAVESFLADKSTEKVDLRGVEFQRDGSIHPDSVPLLESASEVVKSKPGAIIYVNSYCDPTGGPGLNQKLSAERAAAVAAYLKEQGIPADHVIARGFGASNFVASNATSSGRAQNRRIELVIQTPATESTAYENPDSPNQNLDGDRLVTR